MNFVGWKGNFGGKVYSSFLLGKTPLEGSSAEFSELDIHTVEIQMLCSWIIFTISRKIKFCWMPRDLPAFRAPTTPWLSDLILTWQLVNFAVTSVRTASSTATISAQPISCPSDFQPSCNSHASHRSSRNMPIPHPVD